MAAHADDGTMLEDVTAFDLLAEIIHAQDSKPWNMGRFTKTLLKKSDLRIVLISMEKGAVIKEHHADGTIAIQVLRGAVVVTAERGTYPLALLSVLSLAASMKHEVLATEDTVFLLTIAWPARDALKGLEHRGY